MSTQGPSLPFLPLDELGPIFATYLFLFIWCIDSSGFLTASLATSLIIIAGHYTVFSFRNTSPLRLGLTIAFLVSITLFIGGQTAALTFTSVSNYCQSRNVLATFGDQLARISALIVGLNIVARVRFEWAKVVLCGWAVVRLGIFLDFLTYGSYWHCFSCSRRDRIRSYLFAGAEYYPCSIRDGIRFDT